jgi:hypothetical protein
VFDPAINLNLWESTIYDFWADHITVKITISFQTNFLGILISEIDQDVL